MSEPHAIVVAGDVCIDWLSLPVAPADPRSPDGDTQNWKLRGGQRMYARHGGAWLTASFTRVAAQELAGLDPRRTVFGPREFPQEELDSISPDRLIHSLVTLGRFVDHSDKERVRIRVASFEGFAGPGDLARMDSVPYDGMPERAAVVVLDDAGNGFRNRKDDWPRLLLGGARPIVIHKLREPLDAAHLGRHLRSGDLGKSVIVLLNIEELRARSDVVISRALSWEATATQAIEALRRTPSLGKLLTHPHLIVPLGLEGTLHVESGDGEITKATLWYSRGSIEGDIAARTRGGMTGMGSAFAAALAVTLAQRSAGAHAEGEDIGEGIALGMKAAWRLYQAGFGVHGKKEAIPPTFPTARLFVGDEPAGFDVCAAIVNPYPTPRSPNEAKDLATFRGWSILETIRTAPYAQLADEVVREGIDCLEGVPLARFNDLTLIDRHEIENYRAIRNLIREFLGNRQQKRPLCLAVFGPPGAGKSFSVTQVAKETSGEQPGEGGIEVFTFNVSQWRSADALASALHRVRDSALRGNVPLVFFDEFDCSIGNRELAWLKFFLAPMEDGVFSDGPFTHVIGRAIFVFAGGIHPSFREFQRRALSDDARGGPRAEQAPSSSDSREGSRGGKEPASAGSSPTGVEANVAISAHRPREAEPSGNASKQAASPETVAAPGALRGTKARDFLSRLRGYVDVMGIEAPVGVHLLRRAIGLRSLLERKCAGVFAGGHARVSRSISTAFLNVDKYRHGVRSMEAILDMSRLAGAREFTASLLPPSHQLELHTTGFTQLLNIDLDLGANLQPLARLAHENYLSNMQGKRDPGHPSMQPWDHLIPLYKNSNLEQIAHIPVKLAAIRCRITLDQTATPFQFTDDESERLARMEHERWMEERWHIQPDHPDLVPWERLSEETRKKDRDSVKEIPRILKAVGLGIERLP